MFQPVTLFGLTMPLISFILIGFAIAFLIVTVLARTSVTNKLESLFESRLYDDFLAEVDDPIARFFIPDYNREYLRLNAYLAKGDADKASGTFDRLLTMRSTAKQRDDLLFRAFQFYMQQEKFKDAKSVLDEMKASGRNADRVKTSEQTWEIFGNKSFAYIDEMEAAFDDAPTKLQVSLALMLAAQYANKKDDVKALAWQDKAREILETPGEKD